MQTPSALSRRQAGEATTRRLTRVATLAAAAILIAAACTSSAPETAGESTTLGTTVPPAKTAPSTIAPSVSSTTTTTTLPTTTTDAPATTTTATSPTTSTTAAPPADNRLPEVTITSPANLSSHKASYDAETGQFRALVPMSADVSDPDGDPVNVEWYSSLTGYLGSGPSITASLVTIYDSSQPYITARATDPYGAASKDTIQVIVWIPSDT